MSEGNFERELKHFDIDLKQVQECDNFMDRLQEAIDTFPKNGYYGQLEVILNGNLIHAKDRIGKTDTIFGCKVSFRELENSVSFIVKPYEEKTADQMFEELGYEKKERNYKSGTFYEYEHEDLRSIDFACKDKTVKAWNIEITMQELKAINKKCLELRMDRGVINNDKL